MSPDYSSICAQCPQKPCTRTSSLIETRPILIKFFNGIPNTCPARASKHFDQNDWKALGQALDEQTLRRILSEVTPVAALVYMTDRDRRSAAVHAVASGRVPILYTPPGSAAQSHVQNLMQVKCKSTVRAIQKIIEAEEQEQALGAAEQVPKPAFLSAKWILPNSQEQGSSEQEITTTAAALENVVCKVDTEGLSYGDQILFHVYLKGMDGSADTKLDTLASSIGSKMSRDSAVVRFLIPDQKAGQKLDGGRELYFIA